MTRRWSDLLSEPLCFGVFKYLIGAKPFAARFVSQYVRPQAHDKVLDIGCGYGDILLHLPAVDYRGLDVNEKYIARAQRLFGERGTFIHRDVLKEGLGEAGRFDLVLGIGLLHHITDDEARKVLEDVKRVLKPNGRFITLDGCYAEGQSRLARYIVSKDRGRFVRTANGYLDLVRPVFAETRSWVLNGQLRLPYTHFVMEIS